MSYADFLASRSAVRTFPGLELGAAPAHLFPFQADLLRWSLRRGRAAIFADTGLGKTRLELEFARRVSREGRVLVLAPIAVADQTVREGARIGVEAAYCRADTGAPITITNYEMVHHFDPARFAGVVLDESSILKSYDGATRNRLVSMFAATPFRLCCTATPAPNDFTELGNHSEFLGALSRVEMLAEFFVHDGGSTQDWRLKGHAVEAFWRWVASWGAVVRTPAALGYPDESYRLPPLQIVEHTIRVDHSDAWAAGALFVDDARTLNEQRAVRRATMDRRCRLIADLVASTPSEPWLVWCELNDEGNLLERLIPDAVQVAGSDALDVKRDRLLGFTDGRHRVLISKSQIAGFGMNWQHCNHMAFVGPSHSYEQTYQAIRRCWRFGQTRPVEVHIACAENEKAIVQNMRRKEADADRLAEETQRHIGPAMREAMGATERRWNPYNPTVPMEMPPWMR